VKLAQSGKCTGFHFTN